MRDGFCLARKAPRLASDPFCLAREVPGLARDAICLARRAPELAHRPFCLADKVPGLAVRLRSLGGWGRRGGFRATAEAGAHLGLQGVKTGSGADRLEDAVDRQAEDHDVAAEGELGVVGLLGEGGQSREAGTDLVEGDQVGLLDGQVGSGIGG